MADTRQRVLFISDDEDDLQLYRVGLAAQHLAVTTARTVDEAAFVAGVRQFDAIVLAVVSPHGEGWGNCEALRRHPATAPLPVVVLSASVRADRANRDRARRMGCAAFAAKPCVPERLASIVRRVIAGERYLEEIGLTDGEPC